VHRRTYPQIADIALPAGAMRSHPTVAYDLFDGLAHEPWRHGVQPACVVVPGHPGRSQALTTALVRLKNRESAFLLQLAPEFRSL
jgi:hypothetical protein